MKITLHKRTRRLLVALILALLVAWLVALWAIPAAYAERGYRAVGGEWLLITVAAGVVYSTLAHAPRERAVRRRIIDGQVQTPNRST